MFRRSIMLAVLALSLGVTWAARAQQRWVEDEAVLPAGRVRLSAGVGRIDMGYPGVTSQDRMGMYGTGWNAETVAGIGRSVECGVRLGLRNEEGRGLRADDAARLMDTETFGTGIGTVANPEARLRWRLLWRGSVEAGFEERVVFPLPRDPDVTEVLGAWASVHGARTLRLDVALNAVLIWRSFDASRVIQPGLGIPVRLSANITSGLFASAVATTHHLGSTQYTAARTTVTLGAGLGYRYRACDIYAALQWFDVFSDDVLNGAIERTGAGLALSCHLG